MATRRPSPYPYWVVLPAAVVFVTLFLVPTVVSFWFSMTRWDLTEAHFIGWDNYRQFFKEPFLVPGLFNTLIHAFATSATKSVLGLLLAVLLTSGILWQGFLRSVVHKQYQAGFYGLATAGNVILFALIAVIILPLTFWFNRREVDL